VLGRHSVDRRIPDKTRLAHEGGREPPFGDQLANTAWADAEFSGDLRDGKVCRDLIAPSSEARTQAPQQPPDPHDTLGV
jgi:hypothetical protein